jgi:hypothetical protein
MAVPLTIECYFPCPGARGTAEVPVRAAATGRRRAAAPRLVVLAPGSSPFALWSGFPGLVGWAARRGPGEPGPFPGSLPPRRCPITTPLDHEVSLEYYLDAITEDSIAAAIATVIQDDARQRAQSAGANQLEALVNRRSGSTLGTVYARYGKRSKACRYARNSK